MGLSPSLAGGKTGAPEQRNMRGSGMVTLRRWSRC